ncbi:MAG TPA: glycosyltransferase family 2 protein [Patescibacteria group bacterium]|jgi:glycosyltransferase involved in cell wall biosynthesis
MNKTDIPLSVVILTHRKDERFVQALASAQPADEVLVLDFDSNNYWPSLTRQFHFKKINQSGPIKNFSAVRNLALKQARYDWVFFLDSDEEIDPSSWLKIKALLGSDFEGIFVRRRDVFYGKILRFGETGRTRLLRLMKKNASQFVRPVHEIAQVRGKIFFAQIELLHYAHRNISEFWTDISNYAKIEADYQSDRHLPIWLLTVKTVVYPTAKFVQNYFWRLGFLDGWRGLIYAVMMSLHSLSVRVMSYENR